MQGILKRCNLHPWIRDSKIWRQIPKLNFWMIPTKTNSFLNPLLILCWENKIKNDLIPLLPSNLNLKMQMIKSLSKFIIITMKCKKIKKNRRNQTRQNYPSYHEHLMKTCKTISPNRLQQRITTQIVKIIRVILT